MFDFMRGNKKKGELFTESGLREYLDSVLEKYNIYSDINPDIIHIDRVTDNDHRDLIASMLMVQSLIRVGENNIPDVDPPKKVFGDTKEYMASLYNTLNLSTPFMETLEYIIGSIESHITLIENRGEVKAMVAT